MIILLNNTRLDIDIENKSIAEIISAIESLEKEENRIISEISADGITVNDISRLLSMEIETLEVTTKNPKLILLETYQEMSSYLDRLKSGIDKIIDFLERDEEREAMQMIVNAVEGLEWIYNVFNASESISAGSIDSTGFGEILDRYNELLQELLDSLENKDMIMLSDLFGYEVKPLIDNIKEKIPQIYDYILCEEKKN